MKIEVANQRFIDITDRHNIKTSHLEVLGVTKHSLLIADYKWYAENEAEIDAWIKRSLPDTWRNGMVILFGNEQEKLMFLLKWAK